MIRGKKRTATLAGIAGLLGLGLFATLVTAQPPTPLRLTAFAINLGANRPAAQAGLVEIAIERWSTDEERTELLSSLRNGQDSLLKALRENPRVGFIRTPDSVAWDLHYAHVTPEPGGGSRIFLATDRRIAFWEAFNNTRSLNYPFTLIEIHMNPDGKGEGRLSIATKVIADANGKLLRLEDYSVEPVRLQEIHIQKK